MCRSHPRPVKIAFRPIETDTFENPLNLIERSADPDKEPGQVDHRTTIRASQRTGSAESYAVPYPRLPCRRHFVLSGYILLLPREIGLAPNISERLRHLLFGVTPQPGETDCGGLWRSQRSHSTKRVARIRLLNVRLRSPVRMKTAPIDPCQKD